MSDDSLQILQSWKSTRSGAWASRGFHYQHLISTLILARQWAGLAPTGMLVPEGLEDCVVELPGEELWLQIKSRKDGTFSETEVRGIRKSVKAKADSTKTDNTISIAIVLENECPSKKTGHVDGLFDGNATDIAVCRNPEIELVELLCKTLNTAEIIAEGIASDLYKFVADASAQNASLPFEKRLRLSTTEVERRIIERLEAEDPSAIDKALISGILRPVDFTAAIEEPSFYLGVKAKPGHLAAGLILDRPDDEDSVLFGLKAKRHVLISAPSGAGKSALMWLSAFRLCKEARWFQVSSYATGADANTVVQFIRSRRPRKGSPIALALDDLSSVNSDLWDVLVRELRGMPDVLLLGSIRREDENLIANRSDTDFVTISLSEMLAEDIWKKLRASDLTQWSHWREPFERSDGLLLEYVHILTQGQRLAEVIGEQVRLRESESRNDELAILRGTAAICSRGGEVDAVRLFNALGIDATNGAIALRRLINEHLVRESRPGFLGGLHALRSDALNKAVHDEVVHIHMNSIWTCLLAATPETMPGIVRSILVGSNENDETAILAKLAEQLASNDRAEHWIAILTGLGLATLERQVATFIQVLEDFGVQIAHWSLASMFFDPETSVPKVSELEHWEKMRSAVYAFRVREVRDFRAACVGMLPKTCVTPACKCLPEANRLLSSIVPIGGSKPVPLKVDIDFSTSKSVKIQDLADILSTAYLISPELAKDYVTNLGGEETLFEKFEAQTPWVTRPVVQSDGEHGRTVRSDYLHIVEQYQSDPQETVCNICKILIALSPQSDAAASDAISPTSQPFVVGDHKLWSSNMPRRNIVAKARVAWNVAFRQIFLARAAIADLTTYTEGMSGLVRRTEKVFHSFTEKWISGIRITNAEHLAEEINDVTAKVNDLAYVSPETPSSSMDAPAQLGDTEDTLGALLVGTLGNLVPRLGRIPSEENGKIAAIVAGDLADQAMKQTESEVWRVTSSPPIKELRALSVRLRALSAVLHEMAADGTPTSVENIVKAAKKGARNRAIVSASRLCDYRANSRLNALLKKLVEKLQELGWTTECKTRRIKEGDTHHWPPVEVAILVHVEDFEADAACIGDCLEVGQEILENNWQFSIVPILHDTVIASLAVQPASHGALPDTDFEQNWKVHIDLPFLAPRFSEAFDAAIAACANISAILNCRDLDHLHSIEDKALSQSIETFKNNRATIESIAEKADSELFVESLEYLDKNWNIVADELDTIKAGKKVELPFAARVYSALFGEGSELSFELAGARMLLRQAESATQKHSS